MHRNTLPHIQITILQKYIQRPHYSPFHRIPQPSHIRYVEQSIWVFMTADVPQSMYSSSRWNDLADLFVKTHHELFSLPARPLLHIALSAGLSALKTPSCHSAYASSSSNASSSTTTVCPICSTELNELARGLPYAHHTKSYVENDPVVLPNGRIYGRDRLMQMSAKLGLENGEVKDPTTGEIFEGTKVRKVYIS